VRLRLALVFFFFALPVAALAACKKPAEPTPPPRPASSVFSPQNAAVHVKSEPPEGGVPIAANPNPVALAEILKAAPTTKPKPTGPDGRTLVGTNTDARPDEHGPDEPSPEKSLAARADKRISIEEGELDVSVGIPSPALERAARAQLYHPLVMRCRRPDGNILPPDAIVLRFRIDSEGYLVPSSITASAAESKYEDAANCMRRELSAATFRAPAAARGVPSKVTATVPSVD